MKLGHRLALLPLLIPGLLLGIWMNSVIHDLQKLKLENELRVEEIQRLRQGDHPYTRFGNILGCIIDPKLPESYRYNTCIDAAARKFEIDPYIIWHLVQAESKFNRRAESNGMTGLLQLRPEMCPRFTHLGDAASNLHCGVKRLKQYYDQFGDDTEQVLWAWWVGAETARQMKVSPDLNPKVRERSRQIVEAAIRMSFFEKLAELAP